MDKLSIKPSDLAATSIKSRIGQRVFARHALLCALVLVLTLMPIGISNSFYFAVANLVMINAVVAISMTLLIGTTGQLSLGHAGFFALAAYASAYLGGPQGLPTPLGLVLAVLGTAVLSWCVARLFLRLSGYYLAVATLGVGMMLSIVLRNEQQLTGGPDGMSVVPLVLFGFALQGEVVWYFVLLLVLGLATVGAYNLLRSPAGRALRSLHDAEIAATTAGVDVQRYKVRIFVLSGSMAGLMGALYAHYVGFITPAEASFVHSVKYLMMVVVGGFGSIVGAVLGALIVTLLPNLLAGAAEYETMVVGAILLATVLLLPRGLVPTLRGWYRGRFLRRAS
jgi:branched-chain amino acid transport system permease protein